MPRFIAALALIAMTAIVFPSAQGRGRGAGLGAGQPPPPPGDAANGQALVTANKCLDCHRIGDTGSRFGPDLTMIGAMRAPEQLARAIVAPDEDVLPEHRQIRLVTKDGATLTSHLLNQDAFSVQVMTDKEELRSFDRASLRDATILTKGLMPSYEGKLSTQQINDIVNYLASLKGNAE